ERDHFMQMKVKGYAKKTILTVAPDVPVSSAISEMLTRGMGSVIITDQESRPIGIVTTKDVFNLLKPDSIKKPVELTTKDVSSKNEDIITEFTNYVSEYLLKFKEIRNARVLVDEQKNGVLFKVNLYV